MSKETIRNNMILKRRALLKHVATNHSQAIIKQLTPYIEENTDIAIYLPIQNELSLLSLIDQFPQKNWYCPIWDQSQYQFHPIQLPIKITQKDPLGVPIPSYIKTNQTPDIYCVPGLAFDQYGNRVGFGKGVYDRLLAQKSGLKIGIAYDWQIISKIPSESQDISMDLIITPEKVIHC